MKEVTGLQTPSTTPSATAEIVKIEPVTAPPTVPVPIIKIKGAKMHHGGMIDVFPSLLPRFHTGGEVVQSFLTPSPPRFHTGGLAPDERLIVAQTGEGVLSRRGMEALGAFNQGQIPTQETHTQQTTIENHYHIAYTSQAWDEKDARRAFEDDFLPMLMEASSRLKVVEDNGIKVTAGR